MNIKRAVTIDLRRGVGTFCRNKLTSGIICHSAKQKGRATGLCAIRIFFRLACRSTGVLLFACQKG